MKNNRKIIFIILGLLLFCCLFFTDFKSSNYLCSASQLSSSETAKVTFYGEDRLTEIASYNNWTIGSSLRNFDDGNILKNGDFSSYNESLGNSYTGSGYYFDNWCSTRSATTVYYENGAMVVSGGNSSSGIFQPIDYLESSYFAGKTFTISFNITSISGITSCRFRDTSTWSTYGDSCWILAPGIYSFTFTVPKDFNLTPCVYFSADMPFDYFSLKWVKLEVGSTATPYYSYNYLKRLYFENQTKYSNIDDFDIVFTDEYYNYENYFDCNYIVSEDVNLYFGTSTRWNDKNRYPSSDVTIKSSNNSSLYSDVGNNLLNSINLDSIDLNYNYFVSDNICTASILTFDPLYDGFKVGNNFSTYVDKDGNSWFFNTVVTDNGRVCSYNSFLYKCKIVSQEVTLPCFDYNKFSLYDKVNNQYYFPKHDGQRTIVNISDTSFVMEVKIDYNMQFYYSDYFGISFLLKNRDASKEVSSSLLLSDTKGKNYQIGSYSDGYNGFMYNLVKSPYLKNSYVDNFYFLFHCQSLLKTASDESFNWSSSSKESLIDLFDSLSVRFSFGNPKIYFFNAETTDSSSIIPTTSSGLYKEKENWYDFTTDLYNFFIYIMFDAPIISNITSLIYIIISLIIKVIELIVTIFSGVGSTIFISAILGFLLFKFIINKFLGGSS